MSRRLKLNQDNRYLMAYEAIEDMDRKKDFRDEMCHEYQWSKATFYNRINSGHLSPAEISTFLRLIRLYANKC